MKQKIYYSYKEHKDLELIELFLTDVAHYDKTETLGGLTDDTVMFLIDEEFSSAMTGRFVTESNRHELLTILGDLEKEENIILFFKDELLKKDFPKLDVYYVIDEMPDDDFDSRLVTVVPKAYFDKHGHLDSEFNVLIETVLEKLELPRLSESIYESTDTADSIRLSLSNSPYINFIESEEVKAFLHSFAERGL